MSFTIEKHFCGDKLIDISVFSEANKCKMEPLEMEVDEITKIPCCEDKIDVVQGQDELIVKIIDDLKFEQQLVVYSFTYSYMSLFEGLPQLVIPHKYYSPPKLVIDRQIIDQVFLI